jgi:hypothetical protein
VLGVLRLFHALMCAHDSLPVRLVSTIDRTAGSMQELSYL